MLLGQPLLLTGEPGCGKTLFAYSLAWELGFGEPLKFETKSTSVARDLFYTYDALKRFQNAQSGLKTAVLDYLQYNALGAAIVRTNDSSKIAGLLPPDFVHPGKSNSVVLIDEIDKAPRDFPNDILNELENMYFRVPELGNVKIEADAAMHPIVVMTSNSEKDLPDAFLRRCIYYHIPFPNREQLSKIVDSRLGQYAFGSSALLDDALDLFLTLRDPASRLRKKPATAELLGWLLTLRELGGDKSPFERPDLIDMSLSNLVKTTSDQQRAKEIVQQWTTNRKR
jgi:MoxR-like ATPase